MPWLALTESEALQYARSNFVVRPTSVKAVAISATFTCTGQDYFRLPSTYTMLMVEEVLRQRHPAIRHKRIRLHGLTATAHLHAYAAHVYLSGGGNNTPSVASIATGGLSTVTAIIPYLPPLWQWVGGNLHMAVPTLTTAPPPPVSSSSSSSEAPDPPLEAPPLNSATATALAATTTVAVCRGVEAMDDSDASMEDEV